MRDGCDERPPKRPTKSEMVDRISALPEAVLVRILSVLPMNEVVKTGSLSKKWQYLWTTVPNLVFTNHKSPDRVSDFVRFVNNTLILCRHSKIFKFSLSFEYASRFASHVDLWIRFATSCDVQVLSIDFVCNDQISIYTLPEHTFSCTSITNLKLRYCNVVPKGLINLKSLKKLSLHVSDVSEYTLHNIISGSPLLEFLVLDHCKGFKRLDISSTSMRKLIIDGYIGNFEQESILEIEAPNLHSLEIIGSFYRRRFRLVNMLSLVDAYLNFMMSSNLDGEADRNMFIEILQCLSHVKELTLGYTCILTMSRLEMKHWPSLSKRKWLRLYTYIVPRFIPVIEDLLQSFVDLETLIMDIPLPSYLMWHGASNVDPFNSEAYWTSRERIFPCLQLHLKTVKIEGLHESDLELVLPFVAFLLKNACVLEKIEISTRKVGGEHLCCPSKELLKVARKLLNCPRSSRNAVVMVTE